MFSFEPVELSNIHSIGSNPLNPSFTISIISTLKFSHTDTGSEGSIHTEKIRNNKNKFKLLLRVIDGLKFDVIDSSLLMNLIKYVDSEQWGA